jgi:hypothetical protein
MPMGLIVNPDTGDILRQVSTSPEGLALQPQAGELLFIVEDEGIGFIQDGKVHVDETGTLAAKPGIALTERDPPIPNVSLQYVPL